VSDKVGLGTLSPNASLDIVNSTNDTTLYINTTNNDGDTHYGFYNKLSSSGTGLQYGIYNDITTSGNTTNPIYAFKNILQDNGTSSRNITMVRNVVSGAGDGTMEGISQQISNSGNGGLYGINNYLEGSGNGSKYGVTNYFPSSAGGTQYGLFNDINGSGDYDKFGVYNNIPTSAGGTHYGTYSDVQGSSNWAGYFIGRMYVSDKVGLGTGSPNEQLEIANSSGQGRMIVSDGGGTNRYATVLWGG